MKCIQIPLKVSALWFLILMLSFPTNGQKVSFRFSYQVKLNSVPENANSLSMVLPVPESGKYQTINGLTIETKQPYSFEKESRFGNRYLRIHLNKPAIPDQLVIKMNFDVKRSLVNDQKGYKKGSENVQRYVNPDSLIPINDEIKSEANKALDGQNTKKAQAKAFYDYLISSMTYDKSGEGWGRGDALYACNAKEGNCTDFHSLFMGMCRSKKIPARFQIGFPIPKDKKQGEIGGYHCWAEFFLPNKGWKPVDISEAWKAEEKQDFYFGSLDPYRVNFTSGRDIPIEINPGTVKTLNYFIYPKVFVDGENYSEVTTHFRFDKNANSSD